MLCNQKPVSLFLIVCCAVMLASSTYAQTTVKKFTMVNGIVVPFELVVTLDTPSNLSVVLDQLYDATLTWGQVTGANYKLEHRASRSGYWVKVYGGGGQSHTIEDLELGEHLFRVSACADGECGLPTPPRKVTVVNPDDQDSDGIINALDLCADTDFNSDTVDSRGCSDDQIIELYGFSGESLINCIDRATGAVREAGSCTTNEDADSDQDGIIDAQDAYPRQSATQCFP